MKRSTIIMFVVCAFIISVTPVVMFTSPLFEDEAFAVDQQALPVVGSYENLKKLLKNEWQDRRLMKTSMPAMAEAQTASAPTADRGMNDSNGTSADYSATNVQVEGVDEADVVKTDGAYLYQATAEEVIITKAYPASQMKVQSRLSFEAEKFHPLELYVDDKYLVVIGESSNNRFQYKKSVADHHLPSTVKTMVFNLRDKSKLELVREVEMEGTYLSSRKIGSSLYLTTNKFIDMYTIMERDFEEPTPVYRDSLHQNSYTPIDYQQIRYFPDAVHPDYLMVAGFDLDEPKQKLKIDAYLGAGENVYASPKNLYVAVNQYEPIPMPVKMGIMRPEGEPTSNTVIYRFGLTGGEVTYSGKGSVPGRILNQFSLDENKGYLRIATTSGDMWRTDEHTSKNNVYVLDDKLEVTGKLEAIAPGEKIYSVRFMGDRAYMVTFKKVDPLFVLDMKQPKAPKILGKLKIPGYSDYLHPYDENHIIGFGKDAVEQKDIAYYQGIKVALFDVSDVTKPVEKFKEIIGDRGTDSELLHNHKALLFSKEKKLLAFPVTVMEVNKQSAKDQAKDYGEFAFQGALIYQLDLKSGFKLNGKITHVSQEEQLKAGDGWYDSNKNVQRILYINDTLYTVSSSMIKANDLSTLKELGSLKLLE